MLRELEHHRAEIHALAAQIMLARGDHTPLTIIQATSARLVRHRIRIALLESRLAVS